MIRSKSEHKQANSHLKHGHTDMLDRENSTCKENYNAWSLMEVSALQLNL